MTENNVSLVFLKAGHVVLDDGEHVRIDTFHDIDGEVCEYEHALFLVTKPDKRGRFHTVMLNMLTPITWN